MKTRSCFVYLFYVIACAFKSTALIASPLTPFQRRLFLPSSTPYSVDCFQCNRQTRHWSVDPQKGVSSSSKDETSLPQLAEMIDVAFVQACLQLSAGYVDVLKMFIAALYTSYTQANSPSAIVEALNAVEKPASGRPLAAEEEQLRNTWVQAVYCVLEDLLPDHPSSCDVVLTAPLYETYHALVPILKRQRQLTTEFKGKDLLESTRSCFSDLSSPMDEAIALQSIRVMWVTWTVVEEIDRCEGEFSRMDAPRPNIPGAFQ